MLPPVADDVGAAAVAARLADTGTGSRIDFGYSTVLASHGGASGETMPVFGVGVVVLGLGHGYWIALALVDYDYGFMCMCHENHRETPLLGQRQ